MDLPWCRVTGNGYEYLHRNSVPMMLDMDVEEQVRQGSCMLAMLRFKQTSAGPHGTVV